MVFFKYLFILISLNSFASYDAVVRVGKSLKGKVRKVELPQMMTSGVFESLDFKIVEGKNENPINAKDCRYDLCLKAATTFYHLHLAKKYFLDVVKSENVANLKQITIRLDIKNKHHKLGHYAHDNNEPQFNNAKSIPPGKGYAPKGITPWNQEIWFRPSKKIHLNELAGDDIEMAEYSGVLKRFRRQLHMQNLNKFFVNTLRVAEGTASSNIRLLGASLILELSYQNIDGLNKLFSRKWYQLETALVPEIIYHEFAHIALSDRMELTHSSSVNEGVADYFAGQIAQNDELATNIKKYNTFNGKKAKNKKLYRLQFEQTGYANTDFVFGLLWSLESVLGDKVTPGFVYEMSEMLTTQSNIRQDLLQAIEDTCDKVCENGWIDNIAIKKMIHMKRNI